MKFHPLMCHRCKGELSQKDHVFFYFAGVRLIQASLRPSSEAGLRLTDSPIVWELAWIIQCAVERSHSSVGENPIRQGSFQSVAVGTVSSVLA